MIVGNPFVLHRLEQPGTLILIPDPENIGPGTVPGEGQVLCQTIATALSPGTELAAYRGDPPLRPQAVVYPRLVGYCNVARILDCGAGVPGHLQPGDLVLTTQSHRSGFCVAHQAILAKLPAGLDPVTASVTYLFHLGYAAFLKSGATQGDEAALLGLGTLGLTTAAVFANGGVPMTAFSDHLIDPHLSRAFGLSSVRRKEAADMAGRFNHVIVTTNGWSDWRLALELAAVSGTVTVLGFPGRAQGLPDFNPLDSRFFYDKQLTIKACGYVPSGAGESRRDQPRALTYNCQFLLSAIAAGRLPARDLVEGVRPFETLGDIYSAMSQGQRSARTFVLDWSGAHP